MQSEQLQSFIAEVREHLGGHAHITIVSNAGVTSLVCDADEANGSPEQLLALAKLTSCCATVNSNGVGVVVRTMLMPDPDGDKPALCQVRGYSLSPDAWVKIPKEVMPEMYNTDPETGGQLEPVPSIIFA